MEINRRQQKRRKEGKYLINQGVMWYFVVYQALV